MKAGDNSAPQDQQTWALAKNILFFSCEKFPAREQRKRQMLEYSAKGLIGELACVFKITLKEAAGMIQKSLGELSERNLSLTIALARAAED